MIKQTLARVVLILGIIALVGMNQWLIHDRRNLHNSIIELSKANNELHFTDEELKNENSLLKAANERETGNCAVALALEGVK
jgi:Tfp pilus assembly protein PilX